MFTEPHAHVLQTHICGTIQFSFLRHGRAIVMIHWACINTNVRSVKQETELPQLPDDLYCHTGSLPSLWSAKIFSAASCEIQHSCPPLILFHSSQFVSFSLPPCLIYTCREKNYKTNRWEQQLNLYECLSNNFANETIEFSSYSKVDLSQCNSHPLLLGMSRKVWELAFLGGNMAFIISHTMQTDTAHQKQLGLLTTQKKNVLPL